jgi:hypothetical protein
VEKRFAARPDRCRRVRAPASQIGSAFERLAALAERRATTANSARRQERSRPQRNEPDRESTFAPAGTAGRHDEEPRDPKRIAA